MVFWLSQGRIKGARKSVTKGEFGAKNRLEKVNGEASRYPRKGEKA
jgi:hypothetical protein